MKNILIIDDEEKVRRTYMRVLSREGFNPFEADNAVKGREILKNEKIDLVLLDLNMPEVRGEELFPVLKAFHRGTKVIITSVYPVEDQKKAVYNDAYDYFDKSDGPRTLIKKIKFHLGGAGARNKIVVVDNGSIRSIYNHIIKRSGHESRYLGNKKQAVQFIKKKNNRFDIMLVSAAMSNEDINEIIELVRKKHSEAKVAVLCSKYADPGVDTIILTDGYIDLSCGGDGLLNKIDSMLSDK